jgi:hypothetical protein
MAERVSTGVMPGLVPGTHVLLRRGKERKAWVAGTSPAMTQKLRLWRGKPTALMAKEVTTGVRTLAPAWA